MMGRSQKVFFALGALLVLIWLGSRIGSLYLQHNGVAIEQVHLLRRLGTVAILLFIADGLVVTFLQCIRGVRTFKNERLEMSLGRFAGQTTIWIIAALGFVFVFNFVEGWDSSIGGDTAAHPAADVINFAPLAILIAIWVAVSSLRIHRARRKAIRRDVEKS